MNMRNAAEDAEVRAALQHCAQQIDASARVPSPQVVWQRARQASIERGLSRAAACVRVLRAASAVYVVVALLLGLHFWHPQLGTGHALQAGTQTLLGVFTAWSSFLPEPGWAALAAVPAIAAAMLVREGRAATRTSL